MWCFWCFKASEIVRPPSRLLGGWSPDRSDWSRRYPRTSAAEHVERPQARVTSTPQHHGPIEPHPGSHVTGPSDDPVGIGIVRHVVVLDASDLGEESTFWAGMLGGRVLEDDAFHCVFDADGRWVIGVQLAPDHVPPDWPDGAEQQVHMDLHVVDPARAHDVAVGLGARVLRRADDLTAAEGHTVYADPAGHPFCIGWGHPDDDAIRRILGWPGGD